MATSGQPVEYQPDGAWGFDSGQPANAAEWETRDVDAAFDAYGSLLRELASSGLTDVLAHPDLPKVPLAISFAKTEEARQLIQAGIHNVSDIIRPYVLAPGTPKDRVQTLRKAFADTMKDPEFLEDAKKSKLDVDPINGDELEKTVHGLFKLNPSVVAKLKEALAAK